MSARMTNDVLRNAISAAILKSHDAGDFAWWPHALADHILAAIGLDDLDAAVERAASALCDDWRELRYEGAWTRQALVALNAAFTATEEGQP